MCLHLKCSVLQRWLVVFSLWLFYWGLHLSCFIRSTCDTGIIHSKKVFHSMSRETNILFSFIIMNCFNNCSTAFPWLSASNILDFKFYCNRILFYFENDLRWKRSKYKFITFLNLTLLIFPSKWSFWLFYS